MPLCSGWFKPLALSRLVYQFSIQEKLWLVGVGFPERPCWLRTMCL